MKKFHILNNVNHDILAGNLISYVSGLKGEGIEWQYSITYNSSAGVMVYSVLLSWDEPKPEADGSGNQT